MNIRRAIAQFYQISHPDPATRRRGQRLITLLLALTGMALSALPVAGIYPMPLLLLASAAICVLLIVLVRHGRVRVAATLMVALVVLMPAVSVLVTGRVYITPFFSVLAILLAGMVLSTWAIAAVWLITVLVYFLLFFALPLQISEQVLVAEIVYFSTLLATFVALFSLLDSASMQRWLQMVQTTQSKVATQARQLAEQQDQLRFQASLLATVEQAVFAVDPTGRVVFVNPFAERLFGWGAAEISGATMIERFFAPDSCEVVAIGFARACAGTSWSGEVTGQRRDDTTFVALATFAPLRDEHGTCTGVTGACTDITARKASEAAWQISEQRLRHFFQAARDVMWEMDLRTYTVWWSEGLQHVFGYQPHQIGYDADWWRAQVHPDDYAEVIAGLRQAIESDATYFESEFRFRDGAGEYRYVVDRGYIERDADGTALSMFGSVSDVSERRRAEELPRRQAEVLQTMFDHIPVMLVLFDAASQVQMVNREWLRVLGWTLDMLQRRDPLELIYPDPGYREAARRHMLAANPGWRDFQTRTRSGRTLTTSWANVRLSDGTTIGIGQDLSERRRAEEALRLSEERYRLITENTSDLISLLDAGAVYLYTSPSYQRALGYEAGDLVGTSLFDHLHPDDLADVRQTWSRMLSEGTVKTVLRYRHADGSWRWFESQRTVVRQEGRGYAIAVDRDITEQRLLEAQFRQSQKMEAIGRLAGGVAHDFNNLLVVIGSSAELARMVLPADHEALHDLEEIQKAADRAAGLTRQLLAFARRQVVEPQVVGLNDLISEMNRMLRRLIGEDINLITILARDLWPVRIDPGQIEQVIINMAVNARDAMPTGGSLTIITSNTVLDGNEVAGYGLVSGEYVCLEIIDTGVGMDAETRAQLFEPFFTTKPVGQGTGLGLATCYGIVKQNSGVIQVESDEGQGSTFRVLLPRVAGTDLSEVQQSGYAVVSGGHETILVVEDEDLVRSLTVRVLREQGYHVLEADDGPRAIEIANTLNAPIDVLLTDMVMPQMDGATLADRLGTCFPNLKVIFTSGYSDRDIPQRKNADSDTAFLPKPFTPAALTERVRRVLDS